MNSIKFFDKLYVIVGIPWLFLMLFTSGSLTNLKVILLVLLLLISATDIICNGIKFRYSVASYVILFIGYCVFSLTIGVLKGFEFVITKDYTLIQYFIITPLCVLFLSASLSHTSQRINFIWRSLCYLTCILAVLDVFRDLLNLVGIRPVFLEFIELSSEVKEEGHLALRVKNESSFFFLLPIFIYMLFNSPKKDKYKVIFLITTIFGFIYAIVSGRKTLELLILFCIVFAITYKRNIFKILSNNIIVILYSTIIIIILSPVLFSMLSELIGIEDVPQLVIDTVKNGLSSDSVGMTKRVGNTNSLLDLWYDSLLYGNGINSYAHDSLANQTTKWSYEVFYVAWLAQTGIIGVSVLAYGAISIILRLNKLGNISGNKKYYAVMLGFICFLIAGATNPLLYFVWPWTIAVIYCLSKPAIVHS